MRELTVIALVVVLVLLAKLLRNLSNRN